MKIKSILDNFFKSTFHSNTQVFLVLIIITYTFLAIGSGWGYFNAYQAPNFISAFTFTFTMALLFAIYICNINCWLMLKYQNGHKPMDLFIHFSLGICMPILLELLAVEVFFRQSNQSIATNTFLDTDFILFMAYVLLVNAFYAYANHNRLLKLRTRATFKNRIIPELRDLAYLRELHRMEVIRKAPVSLLEINLKDISIDQKQVACAYKIEGIIRVHYFDGTHEEVKQAISKLFKGLPSTDYVKINQACFYHRLLIFTYEEIGSSRQLYLRLRHPFNHLNHDLQRTVSQGTAADFKRWMEAKD